MANTKLLVKLPDLALRLVLASPCSVKVCDGVPTVSVAVGVIVLTLKVPPTVTVEPLSLIIESPIAVPLVNLASLLVVPPKVVTPLPAPPL